MTYYVYIYFDPRHVDEPIYVGKGHGNRYACHLKNSHNIELSRKVAKMLRKGVQPKISVLNAHDEKCAKDLEVFYRAANKDVSYKGFWVRRAP